MPQSQAAAWPPKNILRGIVPVASTWDTAPTSLENSTDGSHATATGTGDKIMAAGGTFGNLVFDLGRVILLLISFRVGIWSTAGTVNVYAVMSDDNITYNSKPPVQATDATAGEHISDSISSIQRGRYLKLRFDNTAAATCYAKIYEVMAWELAV